MKITQKPVEKIVSLPMEEFLNIETESTVLTRMERETELSKAPEYDEKDVELEEGYQEIADKALSGYERLVDEIDSVEGKYVGRLSEVAVTHLNTALSAINAKAKLKEHKDKLVKKTSNSAKTINNTVIINREELLDSILNPIKPQDVITVEHKEIKGNPDVKEE
jgi:hypothetical protein